MKRSIPVLVLFSMLAMLLFPVSADAAAGTFTPTQQKAFDKMAAGSDAALRSKLAKAHSELALLLQEEETWETNIKSLHTRNEEQLLLVKQQMKEIDAAKLASLEEQAVKAKARYQPILTLAASLNKQIAAAKALKNTQLASTLKVQADLMKVPVQLAKADIKSKETALKDAKDAKNLSLKAIRTVLSDIDLAKVQIRAEKNGITDRNKKAEAEWKVLTAHVKEANGVSSLTAFTPLSGHLRKRMEHRAAIYGLELRNQQTINKAKEKLKKP